MPAQRKSQRKKPGYRSSARSSPGVLRVVARLGARLRELRTQRGLTQEQVGEAAGLDSKHVSDLECGRSNPTVASLVGIARALRVSLAELFDGV